MDKDLQALIEDSFQDRQLLQRERIFAYQCIFIMAFTTDSLCSAFNSFWMVSTYLGSARSTCSGSANSVVFFARFCSGSRHSVGCLLVKLPGGQHHEAFARAEILIAFSSRRSHEDLIKSYCTFFLFQVLHVTSSYPFRVFLGMELSDTTPWFTYETSGKGPLPIGCRSGCKAKGVSKSFPSISELLVDENGISGQAEVAARRLRLHGSFQANLVFFFDSTSRLFVSFWNQREQGKWKLASSCREGNHLQKWYVM